MIINLKLTPNRLISGIRSVRIVHARGAYRSYLLVYMAQKTMVINTQDVLTSGELAGPAFFMRFDFLCHL